MSTRWPGGIINQTAPVPTGSFASSAASGVWTLEQQAYLKQQGLWPTFGNAPPSAFIENLFQTWLYTGNGGTQNIVNGINLNIAPTQVSLVGYTITNLGGAFNSSYPMARINDGIVETTNASNIGYVDNSSGYFDVYVDMTTPTTFTQINIAPQGTANSAVYNTPTDFIVKGSNNASTWTTVATFTGVSTGYPNWNAGTFRAFSFTNSTAYRYWRFENTSYGSGGAGITISELRFSTAGSSTGKNGLVWIKGRSGTTGHRLTDTVRGATKSLESNSTAAEATESTGLTAFSSTGFTIGADADYNTSSATYASWTFAQQPKFFDIVTYTGNGSGGGRTISHNLGSAPGMIILKVTNLAGDDWYVYHRSIPTRVLALNSTATTDPSPAQFVFGNGTTVVAPTSTEFTIGSTVNPNGYTFVAYLFAHNAGGFGTSGTDNVISCGSFTSNGGNLDINLGYEPQFVLVKATNVVDRWRMYDVMRGMPVSSGAANLSPNNSDAEANLIRIFPNATGFTVTDGFGTGFNFIYMAIRRPMAVPTLGTQVFNTNLETTTANPQTLTTGFPVDLSISTLRNSGQPRFAVDRLRGGSTTSFRNINTDSTGAENNFSGFGLGFDNNTGVVDAGVWNLTDAVFWNFRRAPGFFDEVCYTGTGGGNAYNHNLTVAPEMMIVKARSASGLNWAVYHSVLGIGSYLRLNTTGAPSTTGDFWYAAPTSTQFSVGTYSDIADTGVTYVAYLFATVAGVSKVGSYTGTGATQTINAGLPTGVRFVLIKRTDSTGNWFIWDTARGMVAGTDPRLTTNTQDAESNANWVYTITNGFQIVTTDATVNASGGTYIYLAIA